VKVHQIWTLFIENSGERLSGMHIAFAIQIAQRIAGADCKSPHQKSFVQIRAVAVRRSGHHSRDVFLFLFLGERSDIHLGATGLIREERIWNVNHDHGAPTSPLSLHLDHSK
jgi:hypothetical protein